jgi:TM2 domain-containing membrane protein YozV
MISEEALAPAALCPGLFGMRGVWYAESRRSLSDSGKRSMASADPSAARRKPWETANPVLSGVLAFLVPGAGHLYQGRIFKGLIYLVCIHTAFFTGMCLGEGMTVHYKVPPNAQGLRKISLSYVAQFGNGVWALPALFQARRAEPGGDGRKLS